MERNDTIAAIATAPGRGGVAIVRVSGPDAFCVAERLTGRRPRPRTVVFAEIREPRASARLIDTAVVIAFRSPGSYTGEDVVEFQCHGGTVAPRRVLEACFAAGARLARRGEFTERALLNGKLTYEAAESVLDLINAKTDRAADDALAGLSGARRRELRGLYDALVALSSTVEHALDVSEDELPDGFEAKLEADVAALAARLEEALRRAKEGKILRDGALVVIAGPPNAGKSSLLNALLGERRAIVSATPGTTRDSIEEWLDVEGWPVRLVDTAGLRETDDAIEGEGVARSRELIEKADVVVKLTPGSRFADSGGRRAAGGGPSVIDVLSKCDLACRESCAAGRGPQAFLPVSAKTGEGIGALRRAIAAALERKSAASDEGGGQGRAADAALAETLAKLRGDGSADLVLLANRVRAAAGRLGEALGATYSDDLLDALFSRFCVGK